MPFHATKRINSKIQDFKWYDISILKIDVVAVTLLLASLFPVLTSAHRGLYVAIVLVCEIYLMKKLFGRGKGYPCCGSKCGCEDSQEAEGSHQHNTHQQQ